MKLKIFLLFVGFNNVQQQQKIVKGLVAKLAPPHAQSAWGSRGKRVRAAELAACCNYF